MGSLRRSFLLLLLLAMCALTLTSTAAHNITSILAASGPKYSEFNRYLTETNIAQQINSRQSITVLAVDNDSLSPLKHYVGADINNQLSLHVLLDYYGNKKLHQLVDGNTNVTTLFQTTGIATGMSGFVRIVDRKGGKVVFASAADGSESSIYLGSLKEVPYNISVLEVSALIDAPSVLTAPGPSAADVNITAVLEKNGCKVFAALLVDSGVITVFEEKVEKGLTVFAPDDGAFDKNATADLKNLSNPALVSVLEYHAAGVYDTKGSLKAMKGPISTLATGDAGKFQLSVTAAGDQLTLHTGGDSARVVNTIIDSTPLSIFSVDSVLLPVELFGKSPAKSGAPVTAPSQSPSPSRSKASPSPSPASRLKAPAPAEASPPSQSLSPSPNDYSPADAPAADITSATEDLGVPAVSSAVLTVAAIVILSSLVS